jgi:hypothetical protein
MLLQIVFFYAGQSFETGFVGADFGRQLCQFRF